MHSVTFLATETFKERCTIEESNPCDMSSEGTAFTSPTVLYPGEGTYQLWDHHSEPVTQKRKEAKKMVTPSEKANEVHNH